MHENEPRQKPQPGAATQSKGSWYAHGANRGSAGEAVAAADQAAKARAEHNGARMSVAPPSSIC
jgi:hypothetical protein